MGNIRQVEKNVLNGQGTYEQYAVYEENVNLQELEKYKQQSALYMEYGFDTDTDFYEKHDIHRGPLIDLPEMSLDYGHNPFGYIEKESEAQYIYYVQTLDKPEILNLMPQMIDMSKYSIPDKILTRDEQFEDLDPDKHFTML